MASQASEVADAAVAADAPPPAAFAKATPRFGAIEMGYLLAAVGSILFATKGIAIKLAYEYGVDAETLLALRMGLSVPIYLLIGAFSLRERRRTGRPLFPGPRLMAMAIFTGLLGYWFASYVDFLGLEYTSAQFERLILFTYPLFVVVFGAMFFRQPMRLPVVVAILLSYVGLAVMFTGKVSEFGSDAVIGAGLVLAAAIAFAFYQLMAKPLIKEIGPRLYTCVAMTAAAVGALVQFFLTHPPEALLVGPEVFGYSLFLAIGATVLPTFMLSAALQHITAQASATISTLSPVATIIMAWAILGETLTLVDVLGTALVLAGVGWITIRDRR